jgi:uncharacterized spore protein YtfJ
MSMEETMKQVAQSLEHEAGVKAVFGEPMKLDNHTVVPVAMVGVGAGGFLPGIFGRPASHATDNNGGGGAGALAVRPVGFIHESGDEVIFTPIATRGRENPFAVQAASSLGHLVNSFAGLFAKR